MGYRTYILRTLVLFSNKIVPLSPNHIVNTSFHRYEDLSQVIRQAGLAEWSRDVRTSSGNAEMYKRGCLYSKEVRIKVLLSTNLR